MPNSPSFVEHVLDLLGAAGPVRARAMFGGHGIYAGDVMIALVDDDDLYLKADDRTRGRFLAEGCPPFTYQGAKGAMEMAYYRPPDEAHEDAEAMRAWALLALEAALRARAAKAPRPKAGKPGKPKATGPKARTRAGAKPPVRAARKPSRRK